MNHPPLPDSTFAWDQYWRHGRLDAMCHAALDAPRARALVASAKHLWGKLFTLDPLVRSDGALFGWVVESATGMGE